MSQFYNLYIFFNLISIKKRSTKPRSTNDIPFKMVTPAFMQHIRNVIKHMVTPSWINLVPYNFSDAAAGPLKANKWRTMSTIYLPLALVSLWGEGTSHPSADIGVKLCHVLDHTMALVSAVTLACSQTTSQARTTAYRNYIVITSENCKIYTLKPLVIPISTWQCTSMTFCNFLAQYTPSGAFLLNASLDNCNK